MHDEATRRRAARLLALSWAVSFAAVPISGSFGSVIVLELTGGDLQLTGVPFFLTYLGSILAAYPAGRLMDRVGRRPVLVAGHLVAALGFALGTGAVIAGSLPLFFLAHLVASLGSATSYLTRIAAADLYPPAERARGLGRLIFALVFGSLAGIPLASLAQAAGPRLGVSYLVAAWAMVPILSTTAALLVSRIRPDPLVIGRALQAAARASGTPGAQRIHWPPLLAAGAAMLFAQATMAAVMSVTGASLSHAGHGPDAIVFALTLHVVGMFGLGPLIGAIGDRWGRRSLLRTGTAYLMASTLLIAWAPAGTTFTIGLIAIGIGWSFTFLGSNALLADAVPATARGRVSGFLDLSTAIVGGLASLGAGWALDKGGIALVGLFGLAISVGTLVTALLAPRPLAEPAPTGLPKGIL